jgi:phosphoglycerate dehydrogenase-like enzyme/predicted dehydrogenase
VNQATNSPLRVLVIGAGPAAVAMHLPELGRLAASGAVALAVVCDVQLERASAARQRFGFQQETSDALAAIARTDIDLVYVFGSAQMHFELGLAALEQGKHLFVEKPVSPSYREARQLAAAAARASRVAVGGHNRRFYRSLGVLRERAGRGGWRHVEVTCHKSEFGKPAPFGARTWLTANGIHALDALLYMMGGPPEHISAYSGETVAAERNIFSALLRWPDGAQAVFACNNQAGSRREQYVFHRPGESFTVTDDALIHEKDGVATQSAMRSLGDGIAGEHAAFLHSIRSGEPAPHALVELAPSLYIAELIEAGHEGRVELPRESGAERARQPPRETGAILIVQSAAQQPAIAPLLPGHRLVSLDELKDSATARPDIGAAILAPGAAPLSAELLARLPQLRMVGIVGLSVVRFGAEDLLARGIRVVNASETYADSVAEFALGLAILGRRRAFASHEIMRGGSWGTTPPPAGFGAWVRRTGSRLRPALTASGLLTLAQRVRRAVDPAMPRAHAPEPRELRGATVGLIGWSTNARALAVRLVAAGAQVMAWSGHAKPAEIEAGGAAPASLVQVLAAEIVSLHRGLTPETLHFLGAAELALLRPGSLLINIARGALVEPEALYDRLRRGDVFACLDTFEDEPLPAHDRLRVLPNVFLTSHIAGGSRGMLAAATREVARKVCDFLASGAAYR